jgi:hypothetical protein
MKRRFYVAGTAGLLFMVSFVLASNASKKDEEAYDTDLSITHYDIQLQPDMEGNRIAAVGRTVIKNLSKKTINRAEFWVAPIMDFPEIDAEVHSILWIEGKGTKTMSFSVRKVKSVFDPKNIEWKIYEVELNKALNPGESCELEFDYVIFGNKEGTSAPIFKDESGVREVYLLADINWWPQVYVERIPGQFPKIYKPSWEMTMTYPSSYKGLADGRLLSRHQNGGMIVDKWESIIDQTPQVFISEYEVVTKKKDDMVVEYYFPKKEEAQPIMMDSAGDAQKIFQLYVDMYGEPDEKRFRVVASHAPWGGHGLALGFVADFNYFKRNPFTLIAHEMAHTWWGTMVSSYGEGSKFLREALAEFSALWAQKVIKGENDYKTSIVRAVNRIFLGPYTSKCMMPQVPLIEQEGYDPGSIIGANYAKGPVVVNQIRLEVGDEVFFRSLKRFTTQYKGKTANIHDFIRTFNQVAGKDLTKMFQGLLWGTGYASYRLLGFQCQEQSSGFETVVKIRNDGILDVLFPLLLKTKSQNIVKMFRVGGEEEGELRYETEDKVEEVVLNPDQTGYHCDLSLIEERYQKFIQSYPYPFDESKFQKLANWDWFYPAHICFVRGEYKEAARLLTQYIQNCMVEFKMERIEDWLKKGSFSASYLFVRGLYYLASTEEEKAESDIKLTVPFLLDALLENAFLGEHIGWIVHAVFRNCGHYHEEIISLLENMTGERFSWDESLSMEDKRRKVVEWKKWWEKKGKYKKLSLDVLKTKYNIT